MIMVVAWLMRFSLGRSIQQRQAHFYFYFFRASLAFTRSRSSFVVDNMRFGVCGAEENYSVSLPGIVKFGPLIVHLFHGSFSVWVCTA